MQIRTRCSKECWREICKLFSCLNVFLCLCYLYDYIIRNKRLGSAKSTMFNIGISLLYFGFIIYYTVL
jgi:hypothetical protein